MMTLEQLLKEHRFFAEFPDGLFQLVAGCARNHKFDAGSYLFHETDPANEFFLVRHGHVALEMTAPGKAPIVFASLQPGEIVGASWLVPPYRWMYDARAMELTRCIGIDAACLRAKCEADHHLGYELMKLFLPVLVQRLHATRLQILDVYGSN